MSPHREIPRRRSREAALQVLYALDLAPEPGEARAAAVFDAVGDSFELPEGARSFAKELVFGVAGEREELDARIRAVARNWRLERMAVVDRNVLRLAAFELVHGQVPTPVVLDEAVELARRFGGEASPGFVNGVLDELARQLREGAGA